MKHAEQRQKILHILQAARIDNPKAGWLAAHHIRDAVGECEYSLSVLEELELIASNGYKYRITGKGVLQAEQKKPFV